MSWTPEELFQNSEAGSWYDPSDISTLFVDSAGTTPVTTDGDLVGRMEDQSGNGNHATQATTADKPTYRTDGTYSWLEFGGTDYLTFAIGTYGTSAPLEVVACSMLTANGNYPIIFGGNSTSAGIFMGIGDGAVPKIRFAIATTPNSLFTVPDSVTLDETQILNYVYNGTSLVALSGGSQVGSASASGTFTVPSEGRIGFISATLSSPINFFGGIIRQQINSTSERDNIGIFYTQKSDAVYESDTAKKVYALGDSTICEYLSQTEVLKFVDTPYLRQSLAAPGNTIAQQKTAWQAETVNYPQWVIVQVGLNDLQPVDTTAADIITDIQDLIDTIRTDVGSSCYIVVAKMTPLKERLIDLYGAEYGAIAYQQWLDVNEAIAGNGATPITGVNNRVISHADDLNDGSGNLSAAYDMGDHVHINNAGREIIADAWEAAIPSLLPIYGNQNVQNRTITHNTLLRR